MIGSLNAERNWNGSKRGGARVARRKETANASTEMAHQFLAEVSPKNVVVCDHGKWAW